MTRHVTVYAIPLLMNDAGQILFTSFPNSTWTIPGQEELYYSTTGKFFISPDSETSTWIPLEKFRSLHLSNGQHDHISELMGLGMKRALKYMSGRPLDQTLERVYDLEQWSEALCQDVRNTVRNAGLNEGLRTAGARHYDTVDQ